jgi:hypothetical protein
MVHKKLSVCKRNVLEHLKEDSETWKKLSKKAMEEYKSDLSLMKKVKRSK